MRWNFSAYLAPVLIGRGGRWRRLLHPSGKLLQRCTVTGRGRKLVEHATEASLTQGRAGCVTPTRDLREHYDQRAGGRIRRTAGKEEVSSTGRLQRLLERFKPSG